ncbi:MAG: DUF3263 domain-containing protein [Propionibacteriaceae bacterium]|jgi:hypothetical protein|nr:DUF3263 domain-containing protein [Propionibacteriaceae bacterium]
MSQTADAVINRSRIPDAPSDGAGLSGLEQAMLSFERRCWSRPIAKEQAIRERFSCSPAAYYQQLNRLIDRPAACAADPLTVKRLRRRREARRLALEPPPDRRRFC